MWRSSGFAVVASALVVAGCQEPPSAPVQPEAPLLSVAPTQGPLQDRYVVVFRQSVQDPDALTEESRRGLGAEVRYRYGAALKGFAGTLSPQALEAIRRNPNVAFVEADGIVTTTTTTQLGATWGLDRIDQRNLPLNTQYSYNADGAGVHASIIDTGILTTHDEFGVRASHGYDAVDGSLPAADCHGHGTHVAGTVGGSLYGVAKAVSLVAVRVLDCSGNGTTAGVIAGVDWVTANAIKPAVANMSLGGGASSSLDLAVSNSIVAGITYAIAAGNSNLNACNYSPARVATAITVGSTTSTDARSSFSNFGSCVDLFAPGSGITSAWYTSNAATNTISGTSMASPHVAGVAALVLQAGDAAPATVRDAIVTNGTPNVVTNPGTGSPNVLLYSLFAGGGDPPPPPPPPPPSVEVHVGGLSGTSAWTSPNKKNWRATVTITVHTGTSPRSGVTVTGNWSDGTTGSTSCTTGAAGTCSVQSGNVSKNTASALWNVGSMSGSGVTYDPAFNTASNITVTRP